jgi:hypothetical protein
MSSHALARRILRLEAIRKPKPTLSATDESWIRENCDEAPFLVSVIKSALSGAFARGHFSFPGKGQA